ncbi:hypothetical protein D3C80_1955210 [compost metagenome]
MRKPVSRNAGAHRFVAGVFRDQNLSDRRTIESVETMECALQQIEAPAAGYHQRDLTILGKLHVLCLTKALGSDTPGCLGNQIAGLNQ